MLKHFKTPAEAIGYAFDELTATLADDIRDPNNYPDTTKELRAKLHDLGAVADHCYFLDDAQHATVLAALRYWQSKDMGDPANRPLDFHQIATNGDTVVSLDGDAIDSLCERLNTGG